MFEQLVENYRAAIYARLLRRVGDAGEAEDLTQETLVRAHRGIETLRDREAALAWLLRIADRVALDRLRQRDPLRDRSDEKDPAETECPALSPSGLQMAEQGEMSACTRRYVEQLSPSHRRVLLLHDVEGMSAKEIAAELGVSEGAAKIRLHRARENLRRLLEGACRFSRDERDVFICEPKGS